MIRYGELANRQDDRQVKSNSGRLASLITIVGLLSFHWLAIYTFSNQVQQLNSSIVKSLDVISISLIMSAILVSQVAIKTLGKFFDRLTLKPIIN